MSADTRKKRVAQLAPKLHFGASLPKPSALRVLMHRRNQAPLQRQKWLHPLEAWQVIGVGWVANSDCAARRSGFDMSTNQHVRQRSPHQQSMCFLFVRYWIFCHVWDVPCFPSCQSFDLPLLYKLASAICCAWTSEVLEGTRTRNAQPTVKNGGKWKRFHLTVSFADATGTH